MCLRTISRGSLRHDQESERGALAATDGRPASAGGRSSTDRRCCRRRGPATPAPESRKGKRPVVDLPHRLVPTFPSFLGPEVVFVEVLSPVGEGE